jgi:hypothetical protein
MSRFFDTFLKDITATPYVEPATLPKQPDVADSYRTKINMYGDVRASGNSDNLIVHLEPTGVRPGIYTKVKVNHKGQVVEGLADGDVDSSPVEWENILHKPTTLAGYNITNVYNKDEVNQKIEEAIEIANPPIILKSYNFSQSLRWRVKHNMFTMKFVKTIWNADGEEIFANISLVDENEFFIEFTSPEAGRVDVLFYLNQ